MSREYLNLLENIYKNGQVKKDRTGVGTISTFGTRMEFDLFKGFPLLTTKRVHWKSVVHELLWFIRGDTNIKYLNQNGVTIWDEWANKWGDIGPLYGAQWRSWEHGDGKQTDQLYKVIHDLTIDPFSRRHIVSAWNVAQLPLPGVPPNKQADYNFMALAPCHVLFQFNVDTDGGLSIQVYQRSADLFLGVPFNIASYALLTHIVAKIIGAVATKLIWIGGDTHIYLNHFKQVEEQLSREPRDLPHLSVTLPVHNKIDEIFTKLHMDNFYLTGYNPHPTIKAPIAI